MSLGFRLERSEQAPFFVPTLEPAVAQAAKRIAPATRRASTVRAVSARVKRVTTAARRVVAKPVYRIVTEWKRVRGRLVRVSRRVPVPAVPTTPEPTQTQAEALPASAPASDGREAPAAPTPPPATLAVAPNSPAEPVLPSAPPAAPTAPPTTPASVPADPAPPLLRVPTSTPNAPFQNPTIPVSASSPSLSATTLERGGTLTAYLKVNNPNSSNIQVGLGMSVRRKGTTTDLSDPAHDKVVTAPPGISSQTRTFTTSSSWATGDYEYILGLWSGTPGSSTWYSSSGYLSGFTLTAPKPKVVSVETRNANSQPKGTFQRGDDIRLYLGLDRGETGTKLSWDVYDPSGTKVSALSLDDWSASSAATGWELPRTIPSAAAAGTYTYTARAPGGSKSTTFTVTVPFQPPTIDRSGSYPSPSTLDRGGSFTAYYTITNPNSSSVQVGLGASIRPTGTSGDGYSDPDRDTIVTIPANTTTTKTRSFVTKEIWPVGSYQYVFAIWSGTPGSSTRYATTDWKDGLALTAPPVLTEVSVSPSTGTTSSRFRYTVVATDPDGDSIDSAAVQIDGRSWQAMSRDLLYFWEYRYYYDTTLSVGTHRFRGRATDSRGSTTTSSEQGGPTVTNRAPNAATNPNPADGATGVTAEGPTLSWSAASDPDSDSVTYLVHYRARGGSFGPWGNATGTSYQIPASLLPGTTYEWQVRSVDSWGATADSDTWSFTTNYAPTLSNGSATPGSGNRSTSFHYEVTYTDADGDLPTKRVVVIDGGAERTMTEKHSWDTSVTDGKDYVLDTTLGLGTHSATFRFNDGQGHVDSTLDISGPTVVNQPPNAPANLSPTNGATDVDPRGPTLDWTDATDPDGDAVTYQVRYRRVGTSWPSWIDTGSSSQYSIPGTLSELTSYEWQARSVDSVGDGTNGGIWSFTTKRILGSITIAVNNIGWSNAVDVPGNDAIVRLWQDGVLKTTGRTTATSDVRQGRVTFGSLRKGDYLATVAYPGPFGEEVWGGTPTITLGEGQDLKPNCDTGAQTPTCFTRNRPVAKSVKFYRDAARTQELPSDDSVEVGTTVYASIEVENLMSITASPTVSLRLDNDDRSAPYDVNTSTTVWSIPAREARAAYLSFVVPESGAYERSILVTTAGELTDSWAWDDAFTATVEYRGELTKLSSLNGIISTAQQSEVIDGVVAWIRDTPIINFIYWATTDWFGTIHDNTLYGDFTTGGNVKYYPLKVANSGGTATTYRFTSSSTAFKVVAIPEIDPDSRSVVTSITLAPGEERSIAVALLPTDAASSGTTYPVAIELRDPGNRVVATATYQVRMLDAIAYVQALLDRSSVGCVGGYLADLLVDLSQLTLMGVDYAYTRSPHQLLVDPDGLLVRQQQDGIAVSGFLGAVAADPGAFGGAILDAVVLDGWRKTTSADSTHCERIRGLIDLSTTATLVFQGGTTTVTKVEAALRARNLVVKSVDEAGGKIVATVEKAAGKNANVLEGVSEVNRLAVGRTEVAALFSTLAKQGKYDLVVSLSKDEAAMRYLNAADRRAVEFFTTYGDDGYRLFNALGADGAEFLLKFGGDYSTLQRQLASLSSDTERSFVRRMLTRNGPTSDRADTLARFLTNELYVDAATRPALADQLATVERIGQSNEKLAGDFDRLFNALAKADNGGVAREVESIAEAINRGLEVVRFNLIVKRIDKTVLTDLDLVAKVNGRTVVYELKKGSTSFTEAEFDRKLTQFRAITTEQIEPLDFTVEELRLDVWPQVRGNPKLTRILKEAGGELVTDEAIGRSVWKIDRNTVARLTKSPTIDQRLIAYAWLGAALADVSSVVPSPPVITTNNGKQFSTESQTVQLEGTMSELATIVKVNDSTEGVTLDLSTHQWQFEAHGVPKGPHDYSVVNADEFGNTSDPTTITVLVDPPPVITTNGGQDFATNQRAFTIEGTAETFFSQVLVNGSSQFVTYNQSTGRWRYTNTFGYEGTHTFTVTAKTATGVESDPATIRITYDATVPTVSAIPRGGTFTDPITVALTANEQSDIFYTTDGSSPTKDSALYSVSITIDKTKTLKFVAIDRAGNQSTIETEQYTVVVPLQPIVSGLTYLDTTVSASGKIRVRLDGSKQSVETIRRLPREGEVGIPEGGVIAGPGTTSWSYVATVDGGPESTPSVERLVATIGSQRSDETVIRFTPTSRFSLGATPPGQPFTTPIAVTLGATHQVSVRTTMNNEDRGSITLSGTTDGIFYTTDGTVPILTSNRYAQPIRVDHTLDLKFTARTTAGYVSEIRTESYRLVPTVAADPRGGVFVDAVTVTLSATPVDSAIYYTIDELPSLQPWPYQAPITFTESSTLRLWAVAPTGEQSEVRSERYVVTQSRLVPTDRWVPLGLMGTTDVSELGAGVIVKRWNQTSGQYELVTGTLVPWEGYWVKSSSGDPLTLPIERFARWRDKAELAATPGFVLIPAVLLEHASELRFVAGGEVKTLTEAVAARWLNPNAYLWDETAQRYRSIALAGQLDTRALAGRAVWLRVYQPSTINFTGTAPRSGQPGSGQAAPAIPAD